MSPEKPTPQHDDEAATPHEALTAAFRDADAGCSWSAEGHAAHALEALKEAGFEITKPSELGVTKGLQWSDRLMGTIAGVVPPLDHMAPGATQAAQTGFELVKRHVAFVGKNVDIPLAGALDLIGRRTDIVAVQLPEPMADRNHVAEGLKPCPMWEVGHAWACITDDGIEYEASGQNTYGTCDSNEARQLATVLLAAANAADAAEGDAK